MKGYRFEMKTNKTMLFLMALLMFMICLTGCKTEEETKQLDRILDCAKEQGYIRDKDILKYECTNLADKTATVQSYDYVYERSGGLYAIRIYAADMYDNVCEISILKGVTMNVYQIDEEKDQKAKAYSVKECADIENEKVSLK